MVLEMNELDRIFYQRKMFQPKYHWVEIKYLVTIQDRSGQPSCLHENAFSQYMLSYASAAVACRLELKRLYIYSLYI